MQIVLQLVRKDTGERSPPVMAEQAKLVELLRASTELNQDDFVLVVGTIKDEQLDIGCHPLMTLGHYLAIQQEERAA